MELSLLLLPVFFISSLRCNSLPQNSPQADAFIGTSLQAVAAAHPILQNQPFILVWNMPTANCPQRYNIHLDLGDFHIVENKKERFQGQKMTIFYRDHLGKYPYLSRNGKKVNGGLPQLSDLASHLSLMVTQLSDLLLPDFSGLAVIDWEEWRPLWETNFGSKLEYRRLSKLLVKQEQPDLSERAVTSLARQMFEESARKFMEETLQSAVGERPKGFWGFYGFPACFNKNKRKTDKTYTGRCLRGTRQQNDELSWLWTKSSALYPSIYLPQKLAGSADAALMVRHRLLEALRVASGWPYHNNTDHATPVLPYARLAFTHSLKFLSKMDLEHTLGESASLGAAGVVLWGELKFAKNKKQCVLLRDYVHNVLGPFVRSLRSDAERCSLQVCHGNGRCTRRHLGSGHRLSDSSKHFQKHFMCHCYQGWTGQGCQDKKSESREEED
ncbi:hyaluronidase-3 isoform X1 [Astatotilapia calliptera]|uniref:Hyaluronidase n=1 Tax=Astatotilapia calliptera TaxID=8154 RepID=A0A3P8QHK3_ASTCA|nr:hyaluronidase-3-like isoform X1 [Astatotilapia calliptera]XP_026008909.1 hyaluronidase-3-like isoform X1 [Astatotilapia calliptera]XP_026008910.1 hyaluronidase-3-like isoform X1 [Astatotilapia calliptera]